MEKKKIEFKGIKEGIYLSIEGMSFLDAKKEVHRLFTESEDFFKGATIVGIKSSSLSSFEKNELLNIIRYKYDFKVLEGEKLSKKVKKILDIKTEPDLEDKLEEVYQGIDEGSTKFVKSTIRSGQLIEYKGNVVIIGDVNPGAMIKARGNIIIFGRLKGTVHAGNNGNRDAIVAAYDLQATQLRIADKISRRPDGEVEKEEIPEIAKIENDEIYIKPYLSKNK